MTRYITFTAALTYNLDDVMANLMVCNPDLSPEDAEHEARETIDGWAEEDFGGLRYTSVEEEECE